MSTHPFFPWKVLAAASAALVLSACGSNGGGGSAAAANQLYSMTNATANTVVHMSRGSDGSLTVVDSFGSGGAGTNTGPDPLISQGSIVLSTDHRMLFAVNAQSNSVSSFSINPADGGLTLEAVNATSGSKPVSLAYANDKLYVLFQASRTVEAYKVSRGVLGASLGSISLPTAPAGTNPTQIELSTDQKYLVVNAGTAGDQVVTYALNADGSINPAPTTTTVTSPFNTVFVSANLALITNAGNHSLQPFGFSNGNLTAISDPVVGDPNGVPCWLVVTPDHKFAYAGNGGSGTISSFTVASNGTVTLLNAQAANEGIAVAGDSWISADGKYLYSAYLAAGKVFAYAIGADGSLTRVGSPAVVTSGNSMQGLVGL